jgi:hypothetical protein
MSEPSNSKESRPLPDPTVLTTQSLEREIGHLKELVEARFNAGDKAIMLLQGISDEFPKLVESKVTTLKDLHNERFQSVATKFADSKVAVDAALQAAEKAGTKTEDSFTKQIDQIGVQIRAGTKSSDDKIDDVKQRLTAIESRANGHSDVWGYVVGAVGVMIGISSVIMMVMRLTPH